MSFEARDMSGSLFLNNKKTQENHPDRTGKCLIDGVGYYVSGWIKKTRDGDPWLSLAFKPIEGDATQRTTSSNESQDTTDIPF